MKTRFYMKKPKELTDSIRELLANSSKLKTSIFKTLLTGTVMNRSAGYNYIQYVNGFLGTWEEFAFDMRDKMKSAGDPHPTYTVGYGFVKDYIFNKYDYSAMISFADAISTGIKEGKFTNKQDIDQFFKFTAGKAFGDKDLPDTVAGLLDQVMPNNLPDTRMSDITVDRRMFNAVKNNSDMFDSRDRITLYNSTKEVVNFLADKNMVDKLIPGGTSNINLHVSAVNSIMDFVTYSLAAYAIRIYAINLFVYPHLYNIREIKSTSMVESATSLPSTGNDDGIGITIMRDADDAECKLVENHKKFMNIMSAASTSIGADGCYNHTKPAMDGPWTNMSPDHMASNTFAQKLFANDLYSLLTSGVCMYKLRTLSDLESLLADLKYITHGSQPANTSAKNEFAVIIRGVACDNTAKAYQKLFADLFSFTMLMTSNIVHAIEDIVGGQSNQPISRIGMNAERVYKDLVNQLKELYGDIAYLCLQKAREIETKYNSISARSIHDMVGLNLSKAIPKEIGTTSDITNAVPDTYRVPIELTDLYALPAFEYYQFYDEAVKIIYGLENDMYYSEAFNVNEVINKIKAFLQARLKSIQTWWSNGKRQEAFNWATKNGDAVAKGNFNNQTMEVLPFKNNGSKEDINLGAIVVKLVNGLNSFKTDILNSSDAVNAYLKSLYPEPAIYDWFTNAKQKGEAEAKFHSYLLFRDINNVSTAAEPTVKITGQEINKRCAWWVDTCKGGQTMYNELIKLNNQLTQAQTKIQQSIASVTSSAGTSSTSTEPLASANGSNQNQENKADAAKDNPAEKTANATQLLAGIQNVITRIYAPMVSICMQYIDTEYRYLKQAYSLSTAAQTTEPQQNSQ